MLDKKNSPYDFVIIFSKNWYSIPLWKYVCVNRKFDTEHLLLVENSRLTGLQKRRFHDIWDLADVYNALLVMFIEYILNVTSRIKVTNNKIVGVFV